MDPDQLNALLDQLKASPEWQQFEQPPQEQPTVASLLAQLDQQPTPGPSDRHVDTFRHPAIPQQSLPSLSFQQALPLLSQLVDDPELVSLLKTIITEQKQLEQQLWSERQNIFSKYQTRYKNAQTKAKLIGGPVSQPEIDMITDGFNKEIRRFDFERALPAWDSLVSKQQSLLAQRGVPTMSVTSDQDARERQQQVIGVLQNLIESKE